MSRSKDFLIGDPVWAKMKGFPPWPAKIIEPTLTAKKSPKKNNMHFVYFFGTEDHAWITDDNIYPYEENKEAFSQKLKKSHGFQTALQAIDAYSKDFLNDERPLLSKSDSFANKTNGELPKKSTPVANNKISLSGKPRKKKDSEVKKIRKKRPLNETNGCSTPKMRKGDDLESSFSSIQTNSEPSYASSVSLGKMSKLLEQKNVQPSHKKFGFLGLGIMGKGIVKNLIQSGHYVTIWNRTPNVCNDFAEAGARVAKTPSDVVALSDITFSCVSDPVASRELIFSNWGVLQGISSSKGDTIKGYVELSSLDPDTSKDIAEVIQSNGGKYLEAPLYGSKKAAEDGTLIILAAGDMAIFNDCTSCFHAMGVHAFYLGDVGNGARMNLVLNMILGATLASLAEGMALAERSGLCLNDLLEILEYGNLNCPAVVEKGRAMIDKTFVPEMPLRHMQKNLQFVLGLNASIPLFVGAAAHEVYKHAKGRGYADQDVSAVYNSANFKSFHFNDDNI